MKRIIMILWQLPQAILGAVVFLFVKKVRIDIDTYYILVRIKNHWGLSLFPFVFINSSASDNMLLHEKGHARQSVYLGPLYLLIVGLPSIIRAIVWAVQKLPRTKYFNGFPENWADNLGGVKR